jgi:hypothetical protein
MAASHNPQACRVTSPAAITLEYLANASPKVAADALYKSLSTHQLCQAIEWLREFRSIERNRLAVEPDPDNVLAKATNGERISRMEERLLRLERIIDRILNASDGL